MMFRHATKKQPSLKAKERQVLGGNITFELREPAAPYRFGFSHENGILSPENAHFKTISFEYQ